MYNNPMESEQRCEIMKQSKKQMRTLKVVLSFLLSFVMVLSPMTVLASDGEKDFQSSPETEVESIVPPLGESGETASETKKEGDTTTEIVEEEPQKSVEDLEVLEISSEEELRALAKRVNDGDSMEHFHVKLTASITISGDAFWQPIGSALNTPFSGYFDGQGHSISGYIVEEEVLGGLFGFLEDAIITNLTVSSFGAPNSTSGLFFSALNTSIDLSRSDKQGRTSLFAMSRTAKPAPWDGTIQPEDKLWYDSDPTATIFMIEKPGEISYLAEKVNSGTTFSGKTIYLTKDIDIALKSAWEEIANHGANQFYGNFIGNGHTIYGLSGSLFGFVNGSTISDIVIDGADIGNEVGNGTAIAVRNVGGGKTLFSRIHVKNSTLNQETRSTSSGSTGAGAVLGYVAAGSTTEVSITQCTVENSTIKGEYITAGIFGNGQVRAISDCAVYNTKILSTGSDVPGVGGIAGYVRELTVGVAFTNCLVLGVDFGDATTFSGIGDITHNTSAIRNIVASDIRTKATPVFSPDQLIGPHVSGGGAVSEISNIFTDSPLPIGFTPTPNSTLSNPTNPYMSIEDVIKNIAWDSVADHGDYPVAESQFNNQGYSSKVMTDGVWTMDSSSWLTQKNFYPQIESLASANWNKAVPYISAAASIPIISTDSSENYREGAAEILLPTTITVGTGASKTVRNITWDGYQSLLSSGKIEEKITDDGILLTATKADVTIPLLTATLQGYKKEFTEIKLIDTVLDLVSFTPDGRNQVDADAVTEVTVTFSETIDFNDLAAGKQAMLQVKRPDGEYFTEAAFPLVSAPGKLDIAGMTAKFTVSLSAGSQYRLVLPEGAFVAASNEKRINEPLTIEFETKTVGSPIIDFVAKDPIFSLDYTLTISDLLSNLIVKEFDGTVMFDGSSSLTSGILPQEYTGPLWDDNNVDKSMDDVCSWAAAAGTASIYYRISDDTVFSSNREAASYQLYVMAISEKGRTAKRTMVFTIKGDPVWEQEPADTVHLQFTKDYDAVRNTAKKNAIAVIPQKDGTSIPCPVTVSIPEKEWNKVKESEKGPVELKLTVVAADPSVSSSSGAGRIEKEVSVFLDDPLYWTATPSPMTMHITTPRQVEQRIDFLARSFNSKIVKYDHFSNNYRTPGTYYVDVYSDPQLTTLCKQAGCKDPNHPADSVFEGAIVEVIQTPGEAIDSSWGNATATLKQATDDRYKDTGYSYSKNIVSLNPATHRMPVFLPEALAEQAYGRMEVNYTDYRWNFYSNTLNTAIKWNDEYNLEVTSKAVATSSNNAIALEFAQYGTLFGTVEFEINLEQAKKLAKNLPTENLGLYRYDGRTEEVVLVSDVMVKEGQWGSVLLNELYPTTYVLKARNAGDVVVVGTDGDLTAFYMMTKNIDRKAGTVQDGDPRYVTLPRDKKVLEQLVTGTSAQPGYTVAEVAPEPEITQGLSLPAKAALVFVAVMLLGSGVVLVIYLRDKKEGK